MKIIKMRAAKKIASFAAAVAPSLPRARGASWKLRFRCCAADELFRAHPAPRREKRSEQTLYDAASREVLQIDFPARGKRTCRENAWRVRCNAECGIGVGREERRSSGCLRVWIVGFLGWSEL